MNFFCRECGKKYSIEDLVWRCSCGGCLNTVPSEACLEPDIKHDQHSLWRYEKALPFQMSDSLVSFQEGLTPLVQDTWENHGIHLKLDYLMPTGSFKDRGVVMMVNYLKVLGVNNVAEDSSGNAGSSLAAYCAKAGIQCDIFAPANAAEGKLAQIALYGAVLHKIPGTRQDVTIAAQQFARNSFYASHNWHPLFLEGTKTLAYEVWEQLGYCFPDNIFVPIGAGSSLLGFYKGFEELMLAGMSSTMPRIFGFQAENCSPLLDLSHDIVPSPTIAEGIAIAHPMRGKEITDAVDKTGGSIGAVTEEEIIAALRKASLKGYFIEPTSAVTLAGFEKSLRSGVIPDDAVNVILLTGSGLKAANEITALLRN